MSRHIIYFQQKGREKFITKTLNYLLCNILSLQLYDIDKYRLCHLHAMLWNGELVIGSEHKCRQWYKSGETGKLYSSGWYVNVLCAWICGRILSIDRILRAKGQTLSPVLVKTCLEFLCRIDLGHSFTNVWQSLQCHHVSKCSYICFDITKDWSSTCSTAENWFKVGGW